MRRLKNPKILAAVLSAALIFANTGVYTLADVDEQTEGEDTVVGQNESDSGSDGGGVADTDSGSEYGDDAASESCDDSESSSDSNSSGDQTGENSGDQTGENSGDTIDEYDQAPTESTEEITSDTYQDGSQTESQGEESFGEIEYGEDVVFDEEISEELLIAQTTQTTQTDNKKKSDDSTEEIPVSVETVPYSVQLKDSVSFDEVNNATFTFTVRAGSNPIRLDSVNLYVYPGDADIAYDPDSKEIRSHEADGYSFESPEEDTLNTGEEKNYTVTIPSDSKDKNGSDESLSQVLAEENTVLCADIGMILFNPEDYSELGRETKAYYIGEHSVEVNEDTDNTEDEQKVFHVDYRIRTVRYDGEVHEMVFPRKVKEGRKVLYSGDLLEWTETPLAYSDEGEYECYYKLIDEDTGNVCRSGTLRMRIRKKTEKSIRTERNINTEEAGEESARTELAGMFSEPGDTEVTDHESKLEAFLDAEGVSNLSGAASKAYQAEITRDHTSFPAVWSWMMAFFMIISFAVFSVTNNIWTGLYKAIIRTCAYLIVFFDRFRKLFISA